MKRYILKDNKAIPCDDIAEWVREMAKLNQGVKYTKLDGVVISTIFLGVDIGFIGPAPILFETMIFGGVYDKFKHQTSTYDEAIAVHWKVYQYLIQKYN